MNAAGAKPNSELVPLSDRQLYLQCYRIGAVAALALTFLVWPAQRGLSWDAFAGWTAGYLILAAVTHRAWRLPRNIAIAVFGGMLLLDGVYLAVVTYGSAGIGTPLQYLVLAHLVTVTLLASFRTGLKLAVWHSLLLASAYELILGKVVVPRPYPRSTESLPGLCIAIGIVMVVTMATSTFAAVNERELRRRNFDLHALSRLAWKLEASLAPEQVAQTLVDTLHQDFGVSRALVLTDNSGSLKLLWGFGLGPPPPSIDPDGDQTGKAVMSGHETVLLSHLDPNTDRWLSSVLPGAANVILLPLHASGDSVALVVAEHGSRPGSRIERRTVSIIERCGSHAALALANAWLFEQSVSWAATDALTGVGNRRRFDDDLESALIRASTEHSSLACLMIDIDHFKSINDRLGHEQGDAVIKAVASAIAAHCRPTDCVARYGGEEFVVLMPGVSDQSIASDRAERIRQFVAEMPGVLPISVSVGVAMYPESVDDPAMLVHAADLALYDAKNSGRNRVMTVGASPGS